MLRKLSPLACQREGIEDFQNAEGMFQGEMWLCMPLAYRGLPKEELKIFGKFGESPSYVCSLLVLG